MAAEIVILSKNTYKLVQNTPTIRIHFKDLLLGVS